MTWFTLVAALLVVAALLMLLRPLLARRTGAVRSTAASNLSIYRDQFAELERDLQLGTLERTQYEAARAELQRRMLDDVEGSAAGRGSESRTSGHIAAMAIVAAVPLLAAVLYWQLGQPEGIGAAKSAGADDAPMSVEEFERRTVELAQRMGRDPEDAEGWLMLGRAYKALQRYPDAVQALSQAHRRQPGEAEIMVEYAEALAQAGEGEFPAQARELLERALRVTPDDAKALTLAGGAAFEAKDYGTAVRHWERLSLQIPADSELGLALASGIGRARELARGAQPAAAAPPPEAVLGEVRLADTLKGKAGADDTVFIFARAAEGPRMPLAITRTRVKDLPARFHLDNSMAMNQERKLSAFPRVIVTARISRTGNAVPQSGDLQGESGPISPGARGVSIVIDQVVP